MRKPIAPPTPLEKKQHDARQAALLSLLVCPGIGHFSLRRPIAGSIYLIIALAAVAPIVSSILMGAWAIAKEIEKGAAPPNPFEIFEMVQETTAMADPKLLLWSTVIVVIVWLVAALDCLRLK